MGVFVDSIGTFNDALNRALELADEKKISSRYRCIKYTFDET